MAPRKIGTRFSENWYTYDNEAEGSIDGYFYKQVIKETHTRTMEVVGHRDGKEVCRVVAET